MEMTPPLLNDVKKNCGFGAGRHPLALETHSTVHRVGLKLHQSDQVGFKDEVQPEEEANFANPCQEEKRRKLCCRIFAQKKSAARLLNIEIV